MNEIENYIQQSSPADSTDTNLKSEAEGEKHHNLTVGIQFYNLFKNISILFFKYIPNGVESNVSVAGMALYIIFENIFFSHLIIGSPTEAQPPSSSPLPTFHLTQTGTI